MNHEHFFPIHTKVNLTKNLKINEIGKSTKNQKKTIVILHSQFIRADPLAKSIQVILSGYGE